MPWFEIPVHITETCEGTAVVEAETALAALEKIASKDQADDFELSYEPGNVLSRETKPAGTPVQQAVHVVHEYPYAATLVVVVRRANGTLEMLKGQIQQAGRDWAAAKASLLKRIADGLQPDDLGIAWDRPGFRPESVLPGSFGLMATSEDE